MSSYFVLKFRWTTLDVVTQGHLTNYDGRCPRVTNGRFKTKLLITTDISPGRWRVCGKHREVYAWDKRKICAHTPLKPGISTIKYIVILFQTCKNMQHIALPVKVGSFEKYLYRNCRSLINTLKFFKYGFSYYIIIL